MALEKIIIGARETLRTIAPKINAAIDAIEQTVTKSTTAEIKATQALTKATETQGQIDTLILNNGQSDAEVLQARGAYPLLYNRLDDYDSKIADLTHQFVDVTRFIQEPEMTINAALERAVAYANEKKFKNLHIPGGTWYVDPTGVSPYTTAGLVIPSNFNLYLANDCILESTANDKTNYRILNLQDSENVNIYGGTIKGDRATHIGTTGEWGHGIVLTNAKNVNIYGTKVIDCWGDGIYLGLGCEKVFIHNVEAANNRRNNLSLISCKVFRANNCIFNNADGTSPMAGVDVEPNDGTSDLLDIKFIDCSFDGNDRGFAVNVIQMKNCNKRIEVEFIRPVVRNSNLGITIHPTSGISGYIKVIDADVRECNSRGVWLIDPVINGPMTYIWRPELINCNKSRTTETDARIFGAITGFTNDNTLTEKLGNVEIIEPKIDSPNSLACISFYDNRTTPQAINGLRIINPIKMISATENLSTSGYYKNRYWIGSSRENFHFKDSYAYNNMLDLASLNRTNYHGMGTWWKGTHFYANSTTQVVGSLLIPQTRENEGLEFTYDNLGTGGMLLYFRKAEDELQYPISVLDGTTAGTYRSATTTTVNASITFRIMSNGLVVVRKVGAWTFAS